MSEMSVTQFGKRLGISRASAYRIVAAGEIELIDGKATGTRPRTRITEAAYQRFLAKRQMKEMAA